MGSGAIGRVTIATVVAATSGYLVLLLAARHLGADGYAVFAVFWAAYGMVTGAQNGQLQETTRAVRAAADALETPSHPIRRGRPLRVNAVIGLVLGCLIAASAWLWSESVFTESQWLSVILLAIGVASFGIYAHLAGALSGSLSWTAFAMLLSVDAMIRLIGAVIAVGAGWGLTAFLVITVIGSVSWMLVLTGSAAARAAVGLPADITDARLASNTIVAMLAAAASAVLVMGFPVMINATGGADDPDHGLVGAVILAVTLTRAPLLVPLNSFQGVLITRFVDGRDRILRAIAGPVGVVVVVGVVGAGAAWLVGPWLLEHIFGADFRLGRIDLASFTLGATTLAVLTVTGAGAIAVGAHRWYAAGWWAATLASIALLLIPASVTTRVALALICGPLIGVAVHLAAQSTRSGYRERARARR